MIVVAIIALLAAIAVPGFLRARQRTKSAKFLNALRVATSALETYGAENHRYPADVNRGVVPPGLAPYLDPTLDWRANTPIGGQWDWDFGVFGVTAALSVVTPNISIAELLEIDASYDDGNLATGRFRQIAADRYADVIE